MTLKYFVASLAVALGLSTTADAQVIVGTTTPSTTVNTGGALLGTSGVIVSSPSYSYPTYSTSGYSPYYGHSYYNPVSNGVYTSSYPGSYGVYTAPVYTSPYASSYYGGYSSNYAAPYNSGYYTSPSYYSAGSTANGYFPTTSSLTQPYSYYNTVYGSNGNGALLGTGYGQPYSYYNTVYGSNGNGGFIGRRLFR